MESVDVVIIGGGPAGSTTASFLAKAGVRALVLEKDQFPRFHIGESLLPQSMKVFERLGVLDKLEARYIRKYGARFVDCRTGRMQTYWFEEAFDQSVPHAYQVPRADFDDLLLRHAEELGAEVRHGWQVSEAIFEGSTAVGVWARDPEGRAREVRARVVVDATGRDTLLASRVRVKHRLPGLDKTAIFGHFAGVERQSGRAEGNIDIVVFPHGWFWNIPFRGEVNSVGAVCSSTWIKQRRPGEALDEFFKRTVEDASFMTRILSRARRLNPVRALADYSYRVDKIAGDGWVMVGDSGGFIDPLFSTGAHLAFRSAELAANQIVHALGGDGDVSARSWAHYERTVRSAAELFMGAVQAFYEGNLSELVVEQAQRKVLRQTITSMLAGDVFDTDAVWTRFLRERYPARLPDTEGELAPAGASAMIE